MKPTLLLAAGLTLAACAGNPTRTAARDAGAPTTRLTVHVVEADGGGWGAAASARAAMESLEGVDRMMMSGTRATLVLARGAKLDEASAKKAVESKGLKFVSLEEREIDRPGAAYVAKTPGFTWAATARKVRATLLEDMPGVQDVFCGPRTVLHMKRGSAAPDAEAVEEILTALKVKYEGLERDDSAVL